MALERSVERRDLGVDSASGGPYMLAQIDPKNGGEAMRITWLMLASVLGSAAAGASGCSLCDQCCGGSAKPIPPATAGSGTLPGGTAVNQRVPGTLDSPMRPTGMAPVGTGTPMSGAAPVSTGAYGGTGN